MIDTEGALTDAEAAKLAADVILRGTSLLIFAEWHSRPAMRALRYYDADAATWRVARTGGPPTRSTAAARRA